MTLPPAGAAPDAPDRFGDDDMSLGLTPAPPPVPGPIKDWGDILGKVTAGIAVIGISGWMIYFVTVKVDAKMDTVIDQHQQLIDHERTHDTEQDRTNEAIKRLFNVQLAQCLNAARTPAAATRCVSDDPRQP